MMVNTLQHCFVGAIPEEIKPGVLYISLEFDTMVHACACGCGHEIVTPLTPTDWQFTYNGSKISVHPSIGNWSHACRSHYVIRRGQILWAGDWTDQQIENGRAADRRAKSKWFDGDATAEPEQAAISKTKRGRSGMFKRIMTWIDGR